MAGYHRIRYSVCSPCALDVGIFGELTSGPDSFCQPEESRAALAIRGCQTLLKLGTRTRGRPSMSWSAMLMDGSLARS